MLKAEGWMDEWSMSEDLKFYLEEWELFSRSSRKKKYSIKRIWPFQQPKNHRERTESNMEAWSSENTFRETTVFWEAIKCPIQGAHPEEAPWDME